MTTQQFVGIIRKNPLGTVCVAVSLVLAVVIYFRSDALNTAEAELAERTALGERYATNLSHGSQLNEHYEALVAANKDIETRFVRVGQLAQNLQYFYRLESETGVKMTLTQITQQSSGAVAAKRGLVPVTFSVSVQGSYDTVVEFLRRIEKGAHFSRILTCSINASGLAGVEVAQTRPMTMGLNLELLGLP